MMVAVAMAPPAHMVIRAVLASRRSSSCSAVVISRAPVALAETALPGAGDRPAIVAKSLRR
jgi:hypothetical protein